MTELEQDTLRNGEIRVEKLVKRYSEEQNDRQVVLVVRIPEDIRKKIREKKHEPPCLSLIDTEISNGRLHLTCYFRSWDAYAGLPANIAGIQIFNESLAKEINDRCGLKIQTGKLIFHSKNCHIYDRQFKLVERLLNPKLRARLQPTQSNIGRQ